MINDKKTINESELENVVGGQAVLPLLGITSPEKSYPSDGSAPDTVNAQSLKQAAGGVIANNLSSAADTIVCLICPHCGLTFSGRKSMVDNHVNTCKG